MLFTARKLASPRAPATALIAGTVLALSTLCAPAYADDFGVLVGGGVGAAAGAVLGQHMGGRQGAIVGGALGAAVGVAASQSSGHAPGGRVVTHQQPDYRASGPGPDVRFYQNSYPNGYAPVAYVPAYGPGYGPRYGYEWARYEEERRHQGHWNRGHGHGHDHGYGYGRDAHRRD